LPNLKNHKLKTLSKHFQLPPFKHHDATEDALVCANIYLNLQDGNVNEKQVPPHQSEVSEFKGLAKGILADGVVNYKEAYELLYWLDDHEAFANHHQGLYLKTKEILEDDLLDDIEAIDIKNFLTQMLIKL
jgi:DNA polymerase III epsilon subunit-like protein